MIRVLLTDDEIRQREMLGNLLQLDGIKVYTAGNINDSINILQKEEVDVVISDYRLEKETGEELLEKVKQFDDTISFIMVTAYGTIDTAVRCMKKGAFSFITKPVDVEELKITIKKGYETRKLKIENTQLKELTINSGRDGEIAGESPEIKEILSMINRVADIDVPVLIEGETGTGKELAAKMIHFSGIRKNEPFVAVNMAGIPETLIESELFGYEKGAFTGAVKEKRGKFELARKGTIFLDEIGEMNIDLQAKLLRVLQENEIERIGSEKVTKTECRVIAATNRDLLKSIKEGSFREDLYYRLNIVKIRLPPLKKRKGDFEKLVSFFMKKYSRKYNVDADICIKYIDEFIELYKGYDFPGNVRELENMVERYLIFPDKKIPLEESTKPCSCNNYIGKTLYDIEKEAIVQVLEYNNGSRKNTAAMLSISERGLRNKLNEYGVKD